MGYARISSDRQAEESEALEQQIARLRKAGASEIFQDIQSGSKDTRPEFNKLMKLVRQVEVDKVIFTRLDRMSRRTETILKTVAEFESKGVGLQVLDQNIDTSTSYGKFQLTVLSGLAQMETDGLSERVKHGWNHVIEAKLARHAPFGYRVFNDKFVLDNTPCQHVPSHLGQMSNSEVAADWVTIFFEKRSLRSANIEIYKKYEITKSHEERENKDTHHTFGFSTTGFSLWLKNPILRGFTIYRRLQKDNSVDIADRLPESITHPNHILINPSQWSKIEEILRDNKNKAKFTSGKQNRPFTGLITCAECKSNCEFQARDTGTKVKKKNYYYRCIHTDEGCQNIRMCRLDKIEQSVLECLIGDFSATSDRISAYQKEIDSRLPGLYQQLEGLEALLKLGSNPALQTAEKQIRNQIRTIEEMQSVRDYDALERENFIKLVNEFLRVMDERSTSRSASDKKESLFDEASTTMLRKLIKEIRIKDAEVVSVLTHADSSPN